ncbi:DUF3244 domain-containing protein [Spirosoma endophyticum]|uniref:Por secretion system C-terminal sorting domain-containing protein n=1 Tax=Spirosoma endophyticum TaxID=662367 RepID=A0A1I1MU82_9BACT|nr:hypothetical protein [Spirosoma endophyticum]SFC88929.1 hypothetical protein SAMN05216167_102712 [Spirosoma endophyticum]
MLPLMSNVAASLLLSASTLINPTNPKALSFDASAYVTLNNQIRLAVQKNAEVPVVVLLRNKNNEVLYRQNISKKEAKYAVKLDVSELADGQYELEIKSEEGSIRKQLTLANQPLQPTTRTIAMQ